MTIYSGETTYQGIWNPNQVYWGPMQDATTPHPGGADVVRWQGTLWVANYYNADWNPATDRPGASGAWQLYDTDQEPNYEAAAPLAPTGLETGHVDDDSITLFWNDAEVPGIGTVTHYNIYVDDQKVGVSTTTSFEVKGLAAGTQHEFAVEAVNITGTSAPAEAFFSTDPEQVTNGKYYSPYIDMTLPATNIVQLARGSDLQDLTLSFMQSGNSFLDTSGNLRDLAPGEMPTLAWGGIANTTLPTGVIIDMVKQLTDSGVNVRISFGGYTGRDPAVIAAQHADQLVADGMTRAAADEIALDNLVTQLQSVIDTYGVTHLDFDVENDVYTHKPDLYDESTWVEHKYAVVDDVDANHLRNEAINRLKAANPDLFISFTVATQPGGVSDQPSTYVDGVPQGSGDVKALLETLVSDHVQVDVVNIMAMDYFDGPSQNQDMGQAAIDAARALHATLIEIGLDAKVGITPMLGQNDAYGQVINGVDVGNEVFTLEDARQLEDFFASTPWVAGFGAWQLPRDRATEDDTANAGGPLGARPVSWSTGVEQEDWEFSSILSNIGMWRANGGAGDDVIRGDSAANALTGGGGVDTLNGKSGNDTLNGGTGADSMAGGDGNDTYYVDNTGDRISETQANGGTDTVYSTVTRTLGLNQEILRLQGSADLNGYGNEANNRLFGNNGNNLLEGNGGNDTLTGNNGADTLKGGTGSDSMNGGAGDDTYFVDSASDLTVEDTAGAAGGTDTVMTTVSRTLGANLENLYMQGAASINAIGNDLGNRIVGNDGANLLQGLGGNDWIDGKAGNDTIVGGEGNDTMTGGGNADLFRFAMSNSGDDTITGFQRSADRFDLSGGSFTSLQIAGGNTTLTYGGGTIQMVGITDMTLAQWNALVVPSGGGTAAGGGSNAEAQTALSSGDSSGAGALVSSPLFGHEFSAMIQQELSMLGHGDFLFA